jgi:hypothetical protein
MKTGEISLTMPKVYLDLDVLNFASRSEEEIADEPEENVRKWRIAREILDRARRGEIELVVSWATVRASLTFSGLPEHEIERFDAIFRKAIEDVPYIAYEPDPAEMEKLARRYIRKIRKGENALHVASASLMGADFFLSWDETHIIRKDVTEEISGINKEAGLKELKIIKPDDFIR